MDEFLIVLVFVVGFDPFQYLSLVWFMFWCCEDCSGFMVNSFFVLNTGSEVGLLKVNLIYGL